MKSLSLLFITSGELLSQPFPHPSLTQSHLTSSPCPPLSYAWALYCMFVFYQAIKKLIKNFRPILKFASVKAIVFATYYQSLAVQASSMSPENTLMWNDFILCIEMVFFAGLLMIAFPTSGHLPLQLCLSVCLICLSLSVCLSLSLTLHLSCRWSQSSKEVFRIANSLRMSEVCCLFMT
jgi:hypothetical protein